MYALNTVAVGCTKPVRLLAYQSWGHGFELSSFCLTVGSHILPQTYWLHIQSSRRQNIFRCQCLMTLVWTLFNFKVFRWEASENDLEPHFEQHPKSNSRQVGFFVALFVLERQKKLKETFLGGERHFKSRQATLFYLQPAWNKMENKRWKQQRIHTLVNFYHGLSLDSVLGLSDRKANLK